MAKLPSFFSKLSKDLEHAMLAAEISQLASNNVVMLDDPAFNWATGGLDTDRVSVFAGDSGSGKTTLALITIKKLMAERPEAYVVWLDAELYFLNKPERVKRLERMGIDTSRILIISTNVTDELFSGLDTIEQDLKKNRLEGKESSVCAIVVDSLGGLRAKSDEDKIAEGRIEDAGNKFGGMAKVFGPLIKKLLAISANNNTMTILVQHSIEEQGKGGPAGAPPKKIITGGQKLRYLSDCMILLKTVERKDANLTMDNEKVAITDKDFVKTGKTIQMTVSKSRNTVDGKKIEYMVNFVTCEMVNTHSSLFDLAKKLEVIYHPIGTNGKPAMQYYAFLDESKKETKFHGESAAKDALKTDKNLFKAVEKACLESTNAVSSSEQDTDYSLGNEEIE